jgi:hypothetical protein
MAEGRRRFDPESYPHSDRPPRDRCLICGQHSDGNLRASSAGTRQRPRPPACGFLGQPFSLSHPRAAVTRACSSSGINCQPEHRLDKNFGTVEGVLLDSFHVRSPAAQCQIGSELVIHQGFMRTHFSRATCDDAALPETATRLSRRRVERPPPTRSTTQVENREHKAPAAVQN